MEPGLLPSNTSEVAQTPSGELKPDKSSGETLASAPEAKEAVPSGPSNSGPIIAPINIGLPAPQSNQPQLSTTVLTDDNPIVAADDEVMEREWVQKAKQIVSETKNDPRSQEERVSKLQADYIKKRFGKDVKLPSN